MVFFISNAIEGQMISTGAFEVTFNGTVMTPNSCTFLYYTGIRNYIMIYINDEY